MAKLDTLFKILNESTGSDLHLAVGEPPKIRVYGNISKDVPTLGAESQAIWQQIGAKPFTTEVLQEWMLEILRDSQRELYLKEHDLDFAYALEGCARFRCNYFVQNHGPAAVFRLIPERILTLPELHLPPVLTTLSDTERGLILITGPTGNGKSTTLAALIHEINDRYAKHIVTVEDPVEFVHKPRKSIITHREVGFHCASFDSALKAAVREDPDVILVGELRDLETIRLALTAAEMGFLVMSTLHTNNASKTIDRIVDVFPGEQQTGVRAMLAGSLVAIVSQLLVRSVDHKGRWCANEILISNPGTANAVREGNTNMIRSIIQGGGNKGMQTMDDSLDKLVQAGKVDPEDTFLKATDKERFRKYLKPGQHAPGS